MTRHGHKLKLANCDLTKSTMTATTKTRIQPGTEDKGKAKYTGEIKRGTRNRWDQSGIISDTEPAPESDKTTQRLNN